MLHPVAKQSSLKLSICIGTFNRSAFIGETLESIISQATDGLEVVICDNASTDNTEQVVAGYASRFERLRYFRNDSNIGPDRNFDRAVELAVGDHCWLLSDDDVIKPGALARVLGTLREDYSLVLVNGEHRSFDMSVVRAPNFFSLASDRVYDPLEMDRLFTELGTCLVCICCVIIKRSVWLERDREPYYGTWFVWIGVIFQNALPGKTYAIAEPLLNLRLDNQQSYSSESFNIWLMVWPSLVWSLHLSLQVKRQFGVAEPWRRLKYLLALRAEGQFSSREYHRWIRPRLGSFRERLIIGLLATVPCRVARHLWWIYSLISRVPNRPREVFWTFFPPSLRVLDD